MTNEIYPISRIFHALSDPTRRAVMERLYREPASVTVLAAPFKMALPTFLKHLSVLEDSGLVYSRKEGRIRICTADQRALSEVDAWMDSQKAVCQARADHLARQALALARGAGRK